MTEQSMYVLAASLGSAKENQRMQGARLDKKVQVHLSSLDFHRAYTKESIANGDWSRDKYSDLNVT